MRIWATTDILTLIMHFGKYTQYAFHESMHDESMSVVAEYAACRQALVTMPIISLVACHLFLAL